jgi:hypothetical protein
MSTIEGGIDAANGNYTFASVVSSHLASATMSQDPSIWVGAEARGV